MKPKYLSSVQFWILNRSACLPSRQSRSRWRRRQLQQPTSWAFPFPSILSFLSSSFHSSGLYPPPPPPSTPQFWAHLDPFCCGNGIGGGKLGWKAWRPDPSIHWICWQGEGKWKWKEKPAGSPAKFSLQMRRYAFLCHCHNYFTIDKSLYSRHPCEIVIYIYILKE